MFKLGHCSIGKVNGIRIILMNVHFRRSAIMKLTNVLKSKEKLIASSFLREVQINKHHIRTVQVLNLFFESYLIKVNSGVNKVIS